MHWMNPSGAWAFSALAAILFLYILKQKMEPTPVSSTFLWQKALASLEADRPFQRLRRSLLLFLQLLLAVLLALSLMRPMTLGEETGETVFVFDLSASMQAEASGKTRLELAVEDALRRLDGMPEGARVSILTVGAQASQPLARAADPMMVRRTLSALTAENGGSDLEGALTLAFALQKELPEVQLVVYSDQALPEGDFTQPALGTGLSNVSLLSLNANDVAAVARVANYGGAAEITVECYADGSLCDLRTLSLAENEIASVQFDLPAPAKEIRAVIVEKDALPADNTRTYVAREQGSTVIVMAGRDNIFLEKALSLRSDVQVIKTTASEAAAISGGVLTVLDGPLPADLPAHGALLLIDPDQRVGEQQDRAAVLSAAPGTLAETLNEYLEVEEIQVARWKPVEGGTPIWLANGQPVLSVFEEDGRRIAVIGFDLHDANLPLLKEFPLFIQNLLSYLAPEPLGAGLEEISCGEALRITPQSTARQAWVVTPSGRQQTIPVVGGLLTDTNEIGVYRVVQKDEASAEKEFPFALHIPAAESDLTHPAWGAEGATGTGRGARFGREWTPWLLGLLLAVMLLEWGVYRRGY